ncbi:hypothetical protein ACVXG8_12695 [Escherichia coli]
MQDDGHAAAKPSAMQAAARHVKSAGYQQGISGPENSGKEKPFSR